MDDMDDESNTASRVLISRRGGGSRLRIKNLNFNVESQDIRNGEGFCG